MTEIPEPIPGQTSIFDIPHARTTDPPTSHAAARLTEEEEGKTTTLRPGTQKHVALKWIGTGPRTALEVERDTRRRGIWKRVSDLKNAGLLEELGTRRDPHTDRDGIVWNLNDRGRLVLELLDKGETVKL